MLAPSDEPLTAEASVKEGEEKESGVLEEAKKEVNEVEPAKSIPVKALESEICVEKNGRDIVCDGSSSDEDLGGNVEVKVDVHVECSVEEISDEAEEKLISLTADEPKCSEVLKESEVEMSEESPPKLPGKEGEVAEILNKLETLKTPEPEEVPGVVRSSFVEENGEPLEEQSDDEDEAVITGEASEVDGEGKNDEEVEVSPPLLGELGATGGNAGNPELQKIREEQIRKWLKYEEEHSSEDSPLSPISESTLESLSSGSIEADSLVERTLNPPQESDGVPVQQNGVEEINGEENGEVLVNGVDGMPRRVRFLTDQEGNLLISVFMTNTPISEESSSMLSNGEIIVTEGDINGQDNPRLVVSPPSLDETNLEQPSAPPIEEDLPASPTTTTSVAPEAVAPVEAPVETPVVPSLEKTGEPQQPPQEEDEGCNSSDETLSVSSCNSMIEIVPNKPEENLNSVQNGTVPPPPPPPEDPSVIDVDENNNEVKRELIDSTCFQLPHHNVTNETIDEVTEEETASTASSSQPPSFIVHEPLPHDEELKESQNDDPVISKLPSIDENNNVVEDKSLPDQIPDLRPGGASSSSDDDERLTMSPPSEMPTPRPAQAFLGGVNGPNKEDSNEQPLVSLCIQEEHISAVALTIAKWESLSKAQSSENLNSSPVPGAHAPVTKTSSSPSPSKPVHKPLHVSLSAKPVQNMPQNQYQPQNPVQIQQIIINGASSIDEKVNNALNSGAELVFVEKSKVPGWNCWGREKDKSNGQEHVTGNPTDEIIYAQPNHQAGSVMTSIANPSAILKSYPKPLSKNEIYMWLREGEILRAGLLLNYGQSHHPTPVPVATPGVNNGMPVIVSWFFGLISRQQAEKYLHGQPSGTFLVRISTRIWGYTLSYQASTGRTKHFLISATNPAVPATIQLTTELPPQTGRQQRMSPFLPQGRYAFIGTNMTPYQSLVSLIRHHSHAPITKLGGEKLLNSCPGGPQVTGLESLFKSFS